MRIGAAERATETENALKPVGAVLIVGGGIAGMQASLDLADLGFKVYLVESQSAIGGKMAQLDKTFPTNDCAMCTISPRLVEVSRHPNIQIMTNTEVLDIRGQTGNFTVQLVQKPRYVRQDKCTSCGDCAKDCPALLRDEFNAGLSMRRAAYKLYPQAVPNAYAIEKRGIAPCRDACPAHQRAQGYIALIREGRWEDALRVIKMDNPFPGICGRICNHRCEDACNRGLVDEPINIRALKRFVTDKVYSGERKKVEPAKRIYEQRVAIIGAGPCGLTAAQDLVLAGFGVTVFEAMPVAGGMLRLGVPEYRLPTEIVEREVQDIVDLGVDLRLNHRIDNLDEVFEQGFDAVLIAVGTHEGVRLPIPGAHLPGVLVNTHFLRDVRLNRYQRGADGQIATPDGSPFGRRVLVLGGGNVAIDCARTALRLGAEVHLACLESLEKMPAHVSEVRAAQEEGVTIHPGRTFERIVEDKNGRPCGVECQRVASFSFDERGRLHVEKIPDSTHVIPCDTVIFSVGQRAGLAFIPEDAGVGLTLQQTIAVNPNTFATSRPGVFAAGDSVSGTAFVIEAVANGHRAAESIIRYLKDEPLEPPPKPDLPVVRLSQQEINERLARGEIHIQPRIPMPELPAAVRRGNFQEIERGYDDDSAQAEAARCLACGICSECMSCVLACGVQAIDHAMPPEIVTVRVGGVILAPGYQLYQAERAAEFGYGRYPNVVNAIQFERLLSATGPTSGHVQRPSDGKKPRRIAFLQCVGSRDQQNDYCSAVCCMYATKEAVIAKEHDPDLEVHIFLMDVRAFSKGYLQYFETARQRYGIYYTRCRVSALKEDPLTHNLIVEYLDEAGKRSQSQFDLVVLSVGMEISEQVKTLGRRLGIELDSHGFPITSLNSLHPLETSRPGIYAVGAFREPKDIPESVIEASGAAACIASALSPSRYTQTISPTYPPERDIQGEPPRIGVFICHCGNNIAGYLDVSETAAYAKTLPHVVHAETNLYTCSQDSIRHITQVIKDHQLNRVVVASCTPLTHAPLFQDSLKAAGLNPFLFEMANIRNHCSWVHSHDWKAATEKAQDLIRMAVARAALLTPQPTIEVPVTQAALVVGGGPAGMTAALSLAEQGFEVHLVERSPTLGGNLKNVYTALPALLNNLDSPYRPDNGHPRRILEQLTSQVNAHPKIRVWLNSQVVATQGFLGNFTSTLQQADGTRQQVTHGVTILATGGQEYKGEEYGYPRHPRILTQQEFEALLAEPERLDHPIHSIVMIQCIGPAEKSCSRICCTVALKNALAVKEKFPQATLAMLYRDIRTYGFKERLYALARQQGVLFLRYDDRHKPQVVHGGETAEIQVIAWDASLRRKIVFQPDYLVLSMPVVPDDQNRQVAKLFKVAIDAQGYFQEAHIKLRPVDFSSNGIFMAGTAHFPKLLDETIVQAQAAASRAARFLCREKLSAGGQVAVVEASRCTACLTCVRICPYHVPVIQPERVGVGNLAGAAYIEPAVCQGCGICAAECPARAIQLMHYTEAQMAAKVAALMQPIEITESLIHLSLSRG